MNAAPRSHFVVALTGGVASGKSAVARRFETLGVNVHDADVATREVVGSGEPALTEIEFVFGAGVLRGDGSLDRRALRERIFADTNARRKLEAIVHPRVYEWLRRRAGKDRGAYCIVAIPLLAETWPQSEWVDRVLLVDAAEAAQIERLMRRDGVSREEALRTLAAQTTREQRRAIADDVIVNDGEEITLDTHVATLHARYLDLAAMKQEKSR